MSPHEAVKNTCEESCKQSLYFVEKKGKCMALHSQTRKKKKARMKELRPAYTESTIKN